MQGSCSEKDFEAIVAQTMRYLDDELSYARTFKVEAKRADKEFSMKSPEICSELGGKILAGISSFKG